MCKFSLYIDETDSSFCGEKVIGLQFQTNKQTNSKTDFLMLKSHCIHLLIDCKIVPSGLLITTVMFLAKIK